MWGLLHWNLNNFQFDLLSFQTNVKTVIHEITHILGFSSILYPDFIHGKLVNNEKGYFINGSFIQKAIREQYGCNNASGMPLETGIGVGTSMSHWSFKTAKN